MNIEIIELASQPHDTLDWTCPIEQAKCVITEGKKIFWQFRLRLEQPFFPLEDELRFRSLSLALIQFSKEVWPTFHSATFGASLYRGDLPLPDLFDWSPEQQSSYKNWILELNLPDEESSRRSFCLEAWAIYFHMLAHHLPDEMNIFLLFDLGRLATLSSMFEAMTKDRFEHFMLALKGPAIPREGFRWENNSIDYFSIASTTGVVFPADRRAHLEFDRLMSQIKSPVKVLFEHFLSEEWEGLDRLIVIPEYLSAQGERMLQGFVAAGGVIESQGSAYGEE